METIGQFFLGITLIAGAFLLWPLILAVWLVDVFETPESVTNGVFIGGILLNFLWAFIIAKGLEKK